MSHNRNHQVKDPEAQGQCPLWHHQMTPSSLWNHKDLGFSEASLVFRDCCDMPSNYIKAAADLVDLCDLSFTRTKLQ